MKQIKLCIFGLLTFISLASYSQTINWVRLNSDQKNTLNTNVAWDYAVTFGISYGRQLKTKIPMIISNDYSIPAGGSTLLDDFKFKTGVNLRMLKYNNFVISTKIQAITRRYNNSSVRLLNFGSDVSGVFGYYRQKWFVAGEVGFDKAIATHFKHSQISRDIYPNIKDGWYEPATGGNFNYGIQSGFSTKKFDITLKIGKVLTQDFKTTPLIPFYSQLGFNYRF